MKTEEIGGGIQICGGDDESTIKVCGRDDKKQHIKASLSIACSA
jgi:hypothetical protein